MYKELSSKDVLNTTNLVFVFPCLQLRDDWITKLGDRYSKEETKKNEAAWLRATNCYFEDILNLSLIVKDIKTIRNAMVIDILEYWRQKS